MAEFLGRSDARTMAAGSAPLKWLFALFALSLPVLAHIGSSDIYVEGDAGPYKLFVTIRTPQVIPGVEEVEIRGETPGIEEVTAAPVPMTGPGLKYPPIPERLTRSSTDPQYFTGSVWMMAPGSWQIRFAARGPNGTGTLSVPVPSAARSTSRLQGALAAILIALATFLVAGMIAISGAAVRDAKLAPGQEPTPQARRKATRAIVITAVVMAGLLFAGRTWWQNEDASYRGEIYKPLQINVTVRDGDLKLQLHDPGWLNTYKNLASLPVARSIDDFVPDHGHLMHLYAIRAPGLDVVFHLHPEETAAGVFDLQLPSMPGGTYNLYADVVHANGFPETLVGTIAVPEIHGRSLQGDDASGSAAPWQTAAANTRDFRLPDGLHMRWVNAPAVLKAKQPIRFDFELVDEHGEPARDMQFYMGMLGHAAFVDVDASVFAHVHPNGTASMAALMQANPDSMSMMPEMQTGSLPNRVSFPYGFPKAGRYRIFVQMRHANIVETGIFEATVKE